MSYQAYNTIPYGSVCSGIEAATVAWHDLGFEPAWYSEIDKFPSAVLSHHYPQTPNLGDMMSIKDEQLRRITDGLLVGGTPCQDFSLAGGMAGFDGARGSLTWGYADIAYRSKARWVVWENVTGVLSKKFRRGLFRFIQKLSAIGYCVAWRVLDSWHWGTPMRNNRVYLVGHLGDWRHSAAVLFDRPATGELREAIARVPRIDASGLAKKQTMPERGRCWTIRDGGGHRFLTPVEAERCFGFPDNYTQIPYRNKKAADCPDGPRYKALGNSMAVYVMRWIGQRIQAVEALNL